MKNTLAALLLSVCAASPALAATSLAPPAASDEGRYTCQAGPLSRVALTDTPAPCCTGAFGCPQLLSTTPLPKPRPALHT